MPVKVRCRGCEEVLNLPDRARGRSIRCPHCETTVKVPAENSGDQQSSSKRERPQKERPQKQRSQKQRPQKSSSQKRRRPAATDDGDNFLGGLDLRRAEDRRVRICAKCGIEAKATYDENDELEEELTDCLECGHNIDTGIMSEEVKEKRARRGPDPEEFWGEMFSGSLAFTFDNIKSVARITVSWGLCFTLSFFAFIFVTVVESETLLGFWWMLVIVGLLGCGGVYWHWAITIIQHTLSSKRYKPLTKVHFNFYQCLALGLKSIVWPFVLFIPLTIPICAFIGYQLWDGEFSTFESVVATTFGLMTYCFAIAVFPIAIIHMSMPYTYKGWLPVNLVMIACRNLGAVFYWLALFFVTTLPITLSALLIHFFYSDGLYHGFLMDMRDSIRSAIAWTLESLWIEVPDTSQATFSSDPFKMLLGLAYLGLVSAMLFLYSFILFFPFLLLLALVSVFTMRANAYIALYFRRELDLVKSQDPNVLCGFGPRYVAALTDLLVVGLAQSFPLALFLFGNWLSDSDSIFRYFGMIIIVFAYLFAFVIPWVYHAKAYSANTLRATIGQRALGIIVTGEDGETLTFGQATLRYFLNIYVSRFFFLGVGCFMAAFNEDKQAFHDSVLKTKVCWLGDDERTQS